MMLMVFLVGVAGYLFVVDVILVEILFFWDPVIVLIALSQIVTVTVTVAQHCH